MREGEVKRIKELPKGTIIYNIITPGNKSQKATYIKAAGTYGQIINFNNDQAIIKLPSKSLKSFSSSYRCSLGIVSNFKHYLHFIGKAGPNRLKNHRPVVRGLAMNPVDHPHGGSVKGRPNVNRWGPISK